MGKMVDDKRFFEVKARYEAGAITPEDIDFLVFEMDMYIIGLTRQRARCLKNYYDKKEERLAHQKAYQEKNKDRLNAKRAEWREKHPEMVRAQKERHYKKHREEILAKHKAKMAENERRCEKEMGNTLCVT